MNEMFENWSEVKEALLEGLDTSKKQIVGTLLENQKQHILTETAAAGAVAANDIAGFRKILIPMIRRIIPGTIATELVGVQPMQGPVGLVYTMRYRYGEGVNVPAAGTDGNRKVTRLVVDTEGRLLCTVGQARAMRYRASRLNNRTQVYFYTQYWQKFRQYDVINLS